MAQERTRGLTPVEAAGGAPDPLPRLRALLRAAAGAQAEARTTLAGEINQVLAKLREPGNESDEARVLVAELDARAFDDLIDARGVASRKEAVQTLLSLGFPHALNVDPGDLAFARKEESREENRRTRNARLEMARLGEEPWVDSKFNAKLVRSRKAAVACAGLSGLALLVYLGLAQAPTFGLQMLVVLNVLLTVGSTAYLALAMPQVEAQAVPIAGVVFGTLAALCLFAFAPVAALIALCGSGAALTALLAWQYEDPGENGFFPPGRHGRNPFDD